MTCGFLYVLSNPSMPGLVKVGKTTREPIDRIKELSSATGVPSPFLLVYSQPVDNCDAAESWVHSELERRGCRPNTDREFFSAPVHEVVEIVFAARTISVPSETPLFDPPPESLSEMDGSALADELYDLGMTYTLGSDSVLVNSQKAHQLFEKASALGHASAAYFVGQTYHFGRDAIAKDLEKAHEYYKRAAAGGKWWSLADIADIFLQSKQHLAAEKYWIAYFDSAIEAAQRCQSETQVISQLVGRQGAVYCIRAASHDISPVVGPDKLGVFRDAIANCIEGQVINLGIAFPAQVAQRTLSFLGSQVSSIDPPT